MHFKTKFQNWRLIMHKNNNRNTETGSEDEPQAKSRGQLEQDPYSYLVILQYIAYGFTVGTSLTPFTPIFKSLNVAYGIEQYQVLQSTGFYLAGKTMFAVFAGIVMKLIGLRYGLLSCLSVFTIGVLLRFCIEISWWLVMLGQLVCGVAASMIIVSQLQLCQTWFPDKVRGFYLAIASISMILGGAFGLFYSLLFVREDEKDVEAIKAGIFSFNMTNLILLGSLVVTHFLLFFDAPRKGYFNGTSQKPSANVIDNLESLNSNDKLEIMVDDNASNSEVNLDSLSGEELRKAYVKIFWNMMAQYNFKVCLLIYLMFNCINVTFSSNINFVFNYFGYPAVYAANLVGFYILGGFIGSGVFFKALMNTSQNVRNYGLFIAGGMLVFICMIAGLVCKVHVVILLIISLFYGFFTMAGIPIILEFFLRLVTGVPFTFVNGIISFFAQILTVTSVFVFSAIYDGLGKPAGCASVLVSLCLLYSVAVYMISKIRP